MAVFTVHEPAALTGRTFEDAARLVFVKDGFSWPALFIPVLWLIYKRMWLILLAYIVVALAFDLVARLLGDALILSAAGLLFALLFALVANDLLRWQLSRKGYRLRAVTGGRDLEECERKFFTAWLKETPAAARRSRASAALPQAPAQARAAGDVIGVFPQPEGR